MCMPAYMYGRRDTCIPIKKWDGSPPLKSEKHVLETWLQEYPIELKPWSYEPWCKLASPLASEILSMRFLERACSLLHKTKNNPWFLQNALMLETIIKLLKALLNARDAKEVQVMMQ